MFRLFGQTATWPQYNQQSLDQSYSVFIAMKVWFFNWCFLWRNQDITPLHPSQCQSKWFPWSTIPQLANSGGKGGWVVQSGARNVVKVRGKLLSCWSVREGWAGGNLLDSAWDIYCIEVPLISLSTILPASPLAHINSWDYLLIGIFLLSLSLSNKVWMYDCTLYACKTMIVYKRVDVSNA